MDADKTLWVDDQYAARCRGCDIKFSFIRRRHHCRQCGQVFCSDCLITPPLSLVRNPILDAFSSMWNSRSRDAGKVCAQCDVILRRRLAVGRSVGRDNTHFSTNLPSNAPASSHIVPLRSLASGQYSSHENSGASVDGGSADGKVTKTSPVQVGDAAVKTYLTPSGQVIRVSASPTGGGSTGARSVFGSVGHGGKSSSLSRSLGQDENSISVGSNSYSKINSLVTTHNAEGSGGILKLSSHGRSGGTMSSPAAALLSSVAAMGAAANLSLEATVNFGHTVILQPAASRIPTHTESPKEQLISYSITEAPMFSSNRMTDWLAKKALDAHKCTAFRPKLQAFVEQRKYLVNLSMPLEVDGDSIDSGVFPTVFLSHSNTEKPFQRQSLLCAIQTLGSLHLIRRVQYLIRCVNVRYIKDTVKGSCDPSPPPQESAGGGAQKPPSGTQSALSAEQLASLALTQSPRNENGEAKSTTGPSRSLEELLLPYLWAPILCDLAWRVVSQTMVRLGGHISEHFAILPIAGGDFCDIDVVSGVAFVQTVASKRMRTRVASPRILLLEGSVGYSPKPHTDLLEYMETYKGYLEKLYQRVRVWRPTVIVVEGGMHHFLQEKILEDTSITLILNVNIKILNILQKCCGARIINDLQYVGSSELNSSPLGTCDTYQLLDIANHSVSVFSGLVKPVYTTVLLRGGTSTQLAAATEVLVVGVRTAYHIALQAHYLDDFSSIVKRLANAGSVLDDDGRDQPPPSSPSSPPVPQNFMLSSMQNYRKHLLETYNVQLGDELVGSISIERSRHLDDIDLNSMDAKDFPDESGLMATQNTSDNNNEGSTRLEDQMSPIVTDEASGTPLPGGEYPSPPPPPDELNIEECILATRVLCANSIMRNWWMSCPNSVDFRLQDKAKLLSTQTRDLCASGKDDEETWTSSLLAAITTNLLVNFPSPIYEIDVSHLALVTDSIVVSTILLEYLDVTASEDAVPTNALSHQVRQQREVLPFYDEGDETLFEFLHERAKEGDSLRMFVHHEVRIMVRTKTDFNGINQRQRAAVDTTTAVATQLFRLHQFDSFFDYKRPPECYFTCKLCPNMSTYNTPVVCSPHSLNLSLGAFLESAVYSSRSCCVPCGHNLHTEVTRTFILYPHSGAEVTVTFDMEHLTIFSLQTPGLFLPRVSNELLSRKRQLRKGQRTGAKNPLRDMSPDSRNRRHRKQQSESDRSGTRTGKGERDDDKHTGRKAGTTANPTTSEVPSLMSGRRDKLELRRPSTSISLSSETSPFPRSPGIPSFGEKGKPGSLRGSPSLKNTTHTKDLLLQSGGDADSAAVDPVADGAQDCADNGLDASESNVLDEEVSDVAREGGEDAGEEEEVHEANSDGSDAGEDVEDDYSMENDDSSDADLYFPEELEELQDDLAVLRVAIETSFQDSGKGNLLASGEARDSLDVKKNLSVAGSAAGSVGVADAGGAAMGSANPIRSAGSGNLEHVDGGSLRNALAGPTSSSNGRGGGGGGASSPAGIGSAGGNASGGGLGGGQNAGNGGGGGDMFHYFFDADGEVKKIQRKADEALTHLKTARSTEDVTRIRLHVVQPLVEEYIEWQSVQLNSVERRTGRRPAPPVDFAKLQDPNWAYSFNDKTAVRLNEPTSLIAVALRATQRLHVIPGDLPASHLRTFSASLGVLVDPVAVGTGSGLLISHHPTSSEFSNGRDSISRRMLERNDVDLAYQNGGGAGGGGDGLDGRVRGSRSSSSSSSLPPPTPSDQSAPTTPRSGVENEPDSGRTRQQQQQQNPGTDANAWSRTTSADGNVDEGSNSDKMSTLTEENQLKAMELMLGVGPLSGADLRGYATFKNEQEAINVLNGNIPGISAKGTYQHIISDLQQECDSGQVTAVVEVMFPYQFNALQYLYSRGHPGRIVESLQRCRRFQPQGGKTKSDFYITIDERFVLKQIKQTELKHFLEFGPSYFAYIGKMYANSLNGVDKFSDASATTYGNPNGPNLPSTTSVLGKMFGVYSIHVKKRKRFPEAAPDLRHYMLMENLMFNRRVDATFDLKGSQRNRTAAEGASVLLDQDLVNNLRKGEFFYCRNEEKSRIMDSLTNDVHLLASSYIMDYSLVVSLDRKAGTLFMGMIDYLHPYSGAKIIESKVKAGLDTVLGHAGRDPTIIDPINYRVRFVKWMNGYFCSVPDKLFAVQRRKMREAQEQQQQHLTKSASQS